MRNKLTLIFLSLIIAGGFLARLYKLNNPVADWHSWRQADTSAVTRNFGKFGLDLLHPRFDDLSNIPSGKDNPLGYRFVEFPIYNLIAFIFYKLANFAHLSLEISGRLTSILASLFSIYFLYRIVAYFWGQRIGLLSAFFMAFLPYNVYYSRTILPEPFLVAFSLGAVWAFIKYQEKDKENKNREMVYYFILAVLFTAIAFLIKPTAVFLLLPIFYLWIKNFKFTVKKIVFSGLYVILAVLPLFLWRKWISQFPEGIPVWTWLLNGDGIRFKGAFFYWLFAERISKLILGYWGVSLLLLGLVGKERKQMGFFLCWILAILLYFAVIATGNVKHDYYQIIAVPVICVFLASGVDYLIAKNGVGDWVLALLIILFTFSFSWYQIRSYYWVNQPLIVEAGRRADEILPKEAKVIAPYGGDTAFLYQTNRQGWPIGFEIEDKIKKGAAYYISLDPKDWETQLLLKKYKPIEQTKSYAIIKLQ